jgi:hypothetical protein
LSLSSLRFDRLHAILLLFLLAGVLLVYNFWPRPAPEQGVSVPAVVAPEAKKSQTVAVPVKAVQVFPKKLKTALNLPASVVASKTEQVVSAAKIRPDDHPHTVTTTIDTSTGIARSYDRVDALPWMAPDTHGAVALLAGFKDGKQIERLTLTQSLLDIKALRLQADATLDSDRQWFAGAGIAWRW